MQTPSWDELRTTAEALATDGDWSALYERLAGEDVARLLEDSSIAYWFAESLYHTARMEELASYASAYEQSSRRSTDPDGVMRALNLGGIAAFELGEPEVARAKFDTLMELAEASGDREMLARAANNLGAIANLKGRRHEALAYYHLAIPLYQHLEQPRGIAQSYHNLGRSYHDMDRLDESVASYARAILMAEDLAYAPLIAMSTIGRAEAELRRGDLPLASRLVERGLELARAIPDPISVAEGLRVRGSVLWADGDETNGKSNLLEALELALETRHALLEAEIRRDIGRWLAGAGQPHEAHAHLSAAVERFDSLGAGAEARALREEISSIDS
jgi:tetratricopeptide (TPR) repeat protein